MNERRARMELNDQIEAFLANGVAGIILRRRFKLTKRQLNKILKDEK